VRFWSVFSAMLILLSIEAAPPVWAQEFSICGSAMAGSRELADKTFRFDSEEYGAGALYLGPDGRASLWIHGDIIALGGSWCATTITSLRGAPGSQTKEVLEMAFFQFPKIRMRAHLKNLPSPIEGFRVAGMDSQLGVQEKADGDVLNLQSGSGPCRLCRPNMTLSELQSAKLN
jgi:hypothetical protein